MSMPSGTSYCIDTTEVTQAQYADFLDADVGIDTVDHPLCASDWNREFAPATNFPDYGCDFDAFNAASSDPVVCVDFCDAVAYCTWAGKRLCGIPGRTNEPFGSFQEASSEYNLAPNDPNQSQWYNACSGGGNRPYPYGDMFDADNCGETALPLSEACATQDAGDMVYDLSGSVREWEDVCAAEGSCRVRGGRVGDPPEEKTCDYPASTSVQAKRGHQGFRCCLDL